MYYSEPDFSEFAENYLITLNSNYTIENSKKNWALFKIGIVGSIIIFAIPEKLYGWILW